MDWAALNRYADGLPPTDIASTEAFGVRLGAMTDQQVRTHWGINSPALIADLRSLFNTPRREVTR
jgi:hypothetical protein